MCNNVFLIKIPVKNYGTDLKTENGVFFVYSKEYQGNYCTSRAQSWKSPKLQVFCWITINAGMASKVLSLI